MSKFKVFQELAFDSHTTFKAHLLGLLGQHIFGATRWKGNSEKTKQAWPKRTAENAPKADFFFQKQIFFSARRFERKTPILFFSQFFAIFSLRKDRYCPLLFFPFFRRDVCQMANMSGKWSENR